MFVCVSVHVHFAGICTDLVSESQLCVCVENTRVRR